MVALTPGLRRRSFEFASVSGLAPSAAALGSSVSVCFVSVGVSTPDICCSIFRLLWIAIAWRGGDSGGLFLHALRSFSSRWRVFHRLRPFLEVQDAKIETTTYQTSSADARWRCSLDSNFSSRLPRMVFLSSDARALPRGKSTLVEGAVVRLNINTFTLNTPQDFDHVLYCTSILDRACS